MEEYLKCPINKEIFFDPVIAEDGFTYERESITDWLERNSKSPMTREYIGDKLIENVNLKNIINSYLEINPKLKNNQYQPSLSYAFNRSRIDKFIRKKDFHQLLKYNEFIFNDRILDVLKHSDNNEIIKHVVENIKNPNEEYDDHQVIYYLILWTSQDVIDHFTKIHSNIKFEISKVDLSYEANEENVRMIKRNENYHQLLRFHSFKLDEKIVYIYENCSDVKVLMHLIDNMIDLEEEYDSVRLIHYLCKKNKPLEVIQHCIERGIDMECKGWFDRTPFLNACKFSSFRVIEYLIDQGVKLDLKSECGYGSFRYLSDNDKVSIEEKKILSRKIFSKLGVQNFEKILEFL